MSHDELISWFQDQCEFHRRILRVDSIVPNSDSPFYVVMEFNREGFVWESIGDGFAVGEALESAYLREGK